MPASVDVFELVGRSAELSAVRGALRSTGTALLVFGSTGTGKSALLRAAREEAVTSGAQVLSATCSDAERDFPYATVHQLVQPIIRDVDLPAQHRRAMAAAFGVDGAHPRSQRVAAAVTALLAVAARRQPLLLLVDDLHLIDRQSRAVLNSVVREMPGRPMTLIGASAEPAGDPGIDGYVRLELAPLSPVDATVLLTTAAPDLPDGLRDRLLDLAGGNPLALVELPKAAREMPPPGIALPLTDRLAGAFTARMAGLGRATGIVLLTLAAEPEAGEALLLEAASEVLGTPVARDAIRSAVDAHLLDQTADGPRFRHRLKQAATYARATLTDRLAVHRALADRLDDPERRLTHRAAAAIGPDDSLATELADWAAAVGDQGRPDAAVRALVQASFVASTPLRRTRILLRAAEQAGEQGDRALARWLLDRTEPAAIGPGDRARLMTVTELVAYDPAEADQRIIDLAAAAGDAYRGGEPETASGLLWQAALRCMFEDATAAARTALLRELEGWDLTEHDPVTLAVRACADPFGVRGTARAITDEDDATVAYLLGCAALATGDLPACLAPLDRASDVWRREGRRLRLAGCLISSALARAGLGRLDRAAADCAEALEVTARIEQPFVHAVGHAVAAFIAARRGDTDGAHRLLRELRRMGPPAEIRFVAMPAQLTEGLLALTDGHVEAAYQALARIFDPADRAHHSVLKWLAVPDLADAAAAAGTVPAARALLDGLPRPAALGTATTAYAKAVLNPTAESFAAARRLTEPDWPLLSARLDLQEGRWLRTIRRYVDARLPLRAAIEAFESLGARHAADDARRQVRASGETAATPVGTALLTAAEWQIARLVARGLSNREIAQRLSISPRTVSSHLYHMFPRLGVTSRNQLAGLLTD